MRSLRTFSVLSLFLLLGLTACKSYQWSGSSSATCSGNLFRASNQCTITFTSNTSFDWSASSSLSGVTIHPSSGSLAAGTRSRPVQVTFPADVCPGPAGTYAGSLTFTDDAHGTQLFWNIVGAGGGVCTLKS